MKYENKSIKRFNSVNKVNLCFVSDYKLYYGVTKQNTCFSLLKNNYLLVIQYIKSFGYGFGFVVYPTNLKGFKAILNANLLYLYTTSKKKTIKRVFILISHSLPSFRSYIIKCCVVYILFFNSSISVKYLCLSSTILESTTYLIL